MSIAREHDLNPQQLFGWRKRFHTEAMALIAGERLTAPTNFAPVLIEATTNAVAPAPAVSPAEPSSIEITIGMVVIRVRGAADVKMLTAVLRAVKAVS